MKILYYRFRAALVTLLLRVLPRAAPVVFQGPGSALTLCRQLPVLGFNRVLLVTDTVLREAGVIDGVLDTLRSEGVHCEIYDGVHPDPTFAQVRAGADLLRDANCQAVLAVGGGSVLDTAKMIAMLHTNPGELADFDGVQRCRRPGVPLFALPTTAGTGSEVSPVAVITDPDSHAKTLVVDSKMIPGHAALDAELMRGMPPAVTAATGMDALTHAVESYLSRASTPRSEVRALAALRLIFRYLPRAFASGDDLEARDAMALAAFYAGCAFSDTSVGYAHAIAHQLGRVCGTPHGNANAMVLPEVLAAYGDCVHGRLADLGRQVGVDDSGGDAAVAARFIAAIAGLRSRLDMPLLPRGLKQEHLAAIVREAAAEAGSLYPVQRYLSAGEIASIVRGLLPASQPTELELRSDGH